MTWNWRPVARWQRLLAALLIVGAASAFRLAFFGSLGRGIPYLVFYPAVMLAALYGGLAGGFLATALSVPLSFFWVQQGHLSPPEWMGMAVFVVSCAIVTAIGEGMRRSETRAKLAQGRAEAANQELRSEMAERKRAEQALQASKEELQRLLDSMTAAAEEAARMVTVVRDSNDAITIQDFDGRITAWNHGAELMYGYSEAEALHMNIERLTAPGKADEQRDFVRRLVAGEAVTSLETQRVTKDGRILDVWMTVTKLVDKAGTPIGIASTERDTTARKREEDLRYRSERRLRTVIDASPFPVAIVDLQDDKIHYWSRSALTLFGHTAPTASAWYEMAYPDPAYRQDVINRWKPFLEEAKSSGNSVNTGEYRVTCRDGSVLICELHAALIDDSLIVTFSNITARKQEEKNLRRLATVVKDSNDALLIKDFEGRITAWNRGAELMYGYSEAEALQMNIGHLTPADKIEEQRDFTSRLVAGEAITSFETQRVTKDGRVLDVWMTVTKLLDDAGTPMGIASTERDITARKKAETATRQSALTLQDKNAELERFLYTTSHDLKSPVVTVRTFLDYLEQDMAKADAGRIEKDMRFIRTAADKMARLLDELLQISRIGRVVSPPVRVTFRALMDETLSTVAGRIAGRGVTVMVGEQDVPLHGDPLRLAEIWQNLVENACKFMGDQKEPRIEMGAETRGAETVFFVRDNGMGIDPHYHAKVFSLFEKLDSKAEGTGLGLAIVKRIVELYRGRIWVESPGQGQGACFYFTLPEAVSTQEAGVRSQGAE